MKEAPGRLNVIREFVNTYDVEDGEEKLDSPTALAAWLAERALSGGDSRIDSAGLQRVRRLREALRALMFANNGEPLSEGVVEELNELARGADLYLHFDAAGEARLQPCSRGADAAIGDLLAIVAAAMSDGTWPRMKACREHSCSWAFYDASRNRSGAWCDMGVCGNRAKARAFRERRRGAAGAR